MTYLALFLIGILSAMTGTITAGGSGLIFLVVAGLVLPLPVATIVLGFAGTIGAVYRAWVFRKNLNWPILKWLMPGTLIGASLGAFLFGTLIESSNTEALKIFLGILLLFSGLFGFFKIKVLNIPARKYYFLPMGIFTSFLSGLIGAASPIINVLFQKFPLTPSEIIGTKAFNGFVLQLFKTLIYVFSIVISHKIFLDEKILSTQEFLILGSIAASGSCVGVHMGKRVLDKIDEKAFDKILNAMIFFYGFYLLVKIIIV